jgi:hypothetical protein
MTVDVICENSELCEKLQKCDGLTDKLQLWMNSFYAVFFIEQLKLKEKSKYYEYLSSFPLNITNYPELFSDKEMKMLEGSVDLLIAIKKRTVDNKLEYEALCNSESSFKSVISFREY